jgi:hypothetical protein
MDNIMARGIALIEASADPQGGVVFSTSLPAKIPNGLIGLASAIQNFFKNQFF